MKRVKNHSNVIDVRFAFAVYRPPIDPIWQPDN